MMTDRYDWVVRQVEEVASAVRKIAASLIDADEDEVIEISAQADGLLEKSFDHSRIDLVDVRTAAMILRPPARIRSYARLLALKAELLHQSGERDASTQVARRALELQLEAAALETNPEKIDHEAIEALLDRDPPLRLAQRHHALLAELYEEEGEGA